MQFLKKFKIFCCTISAICLTGVGISAQTLTSQPVVSPVSAIDVKARAAVLMDAETGTLLFTKNEHEPIPPASLTKLMTIHIALSEVAAGNAVLDERVPLLEESWAVNQPPRSSLMWLAQGQRVNLGELLLGLAIPSGNDAAVAVALRFAPSVEEFAARASALGLKATRFVEPSGVSEYNMTTADDFVRFCRFYLSEHPETLKMLHSVPSFSYPKAENAPAAARRPPAVVEQANRNPLIGEGGVDGLKTGYIDESGYNIALTAEQDGTRLIAVILGAETIAIRDADGRRLLSWGFNNYATLRPVLDKPLPDVRVWKSSVKYARVELSEPLVFTARKGRGEDMRFETQFFDSPDNSEESVQKTRTFAPLIAPLPKGTEAGELVLIDSVGELRRIPITLAEDVPAGGFWTRLFDVIKLFFMNLWRK